MKRVVVIGAGAAGTMAAIFAASSGAETLLLERTKDGGRKILMSGGGRCNILPAVVHEPRFVTDSSPHTLRKMLRAWPLSEQIAFFEDEAGIPLMEETESAKLFPKSESARDVRDRLLALARARGVVIETDALVAGFIPAGNGWQIERQGGPSLRADAVVVATGGLSVPSTGSDGLGLRIVETLGHTINRTYPALTPLTATVGRKPGTTGGAPFATLAGISLQVTLTARAGTLQSTSTGGFLFTHNGYSGPAVLDVSHVAVRSRAEMGAPARLVVRWTPLNDKDWESALGSRGARTVLNAVAAQLPRRLAEALIEFAGIDLRRTLSQLPRDERLRLIDILVRGELPWSGDEGYGKAEVTGGGVRLSEIDPKTMESKMHKGLFL
ncbi:MAG: aminoacetone oxidase family FAD-binding enzyme, partial [candidate division NC10 bacterium]|nr:aminoacetone oxidase family FAD-binding enzyme [candidate division NC10 bacterium]